MAFDIFRVLSLSFLGDGWKECYLKFNYLTAAETRQISELPISTKDPSKDNVQAIFKNVVEILEGKFVEGKAVRNSAVVDVRKEDIKDFPLDVINKSLTMLTGVTDEGKKKTTE